MLKKIRIESNNVCFGPFPENDEEVEQHLTINSAGRVWLTRKSFSDEVIEKKQFSIGKEMASRLLITFEKRFSGNPHITFVADVGCWEITLTYEDGREKAFKGSFLVEEFGNVSGLSDIVREAVGRDDLFVFDGNPDRIEDLTVKYWRVSRIRPKAILKGAAKGDITWKYYEELTLDRRKETLKHIKKMAAQCKQTNVYKVEGGISNLLDGLCPEIFDDMPKVPYDGINNPDNMRTYELIIHTKHGEEKSYSGFFDKYGLPDKWPDFIEKVYDFMAFYGEGELFDEAY